VSAFIPGIELCRQYWRDIVAPIIDSLLPGLPRAAALVGTGSEVLGFDTQRSTDHGWGPRVVVLLPDDADLSATRHGDLAAAIDARLPDAFGVYSTRFAAQTGGEVRNQVTLTTVNAWFMGSLGFDPRGDITTTDWLSTPSQLLRTTTSGAVFEDDSQLLTTARERLAWYPDDVWLYLLACQWQRVNQEEPFVGRTGEVGDDLGSAVVTARLVRDLMRLCFLIEQRYAPYTKWLGTAFSRLQCSERLTPSFQSALRATDWRERENALVPAAEMIAQAFNELDVTEPQDPSARHFYDRPFLVLGAERFAQACMAKTSLAGLGSVGGIDQFVDSTDVLAYPHRAARLRDFIASG